MKIIAISNQKGGVGKTTTTMALGEAMVRAGKRVLLVDLDAQANLTMSMGYKTPDEIPITIATMFKAYIAGKLAEIPADYVLSVKGVDFLPASIELSELDYLLMTAMNREYILKKILSRYQERYDYVIIDCLPSLNLLAVNALAAADEIIIPVQAQYLSAKGLDLLLQTVLKVQANLNPGLKIGGIVITMLDGRAVFKKELVQEITEAYGTAIHFFTSTIPLSVKVSEAQANANEIIAMKRNKVADAYLNLAEEVMCNG